MDGGTGNVALARNFKIRHSGIAYQKRENLPVDLVQLIISHSVLVYFFFPNLELLPVGVPWAMMSWQSFSLRAEASLPLGIL